MQLYSAVTQYAMKIIYSNIDQSASIYENAYNMDLFYWIGSDSCVIDLLN